MAYVKMFLIELNVGWTFSVPQAELTNLSILKNNLVLGPNELARIEAIKIFLRFEASMPDRFHQFLVVVEWGPWDNVSVVCE